MIHKLTLIQCLREIIKKSDNLYLKYHSRRYEELVNFVRDNYSDDKRILDVGNSRFTEILAKLFSCQIDELGFSKDSTRNFGNQYQFDLNCCCDKNKWRTDIGPYDIIIFAEVIEHLYTSPNQVLKYLSSILKEKGKLIIQTPNASVLHKRIQLAMGKNPYMLIRENRCNPGHFREYTRNELKEYAKNCDFQIDRIYYTSYYDYRYTFAQSMNGQVCKIFSIINAMYSFLPSSLKPGITMKLSKK